MKTDLKKQIPTYAARHGLFQVVTVPPLQYLMIDGHGDPNTSTAYRDALTTIYPVAYRLKFFSKNVLGRDYTMMPLEAQGWADDMDTFTSARDKSQWDWTVLIMTPDWLGAEHFADARDAVRRKNAAPALGRIRLDTLEERLAVQTLHVDSYDDEGRVLDALHNEFIPSRSLRMTGKHHEIYLSDPRRVAPEKLRTILRQPVSEAGN